MKQQIRYQTIYKLFSIFLLVILMLSGVITNGLSSAQAQENSSETQTVAPECFTLDLMVGSGEGTLTATTPQNCDSGYLEGTVVEVLASPAEGFVVQQWQGTNDDTLQTLINGAVIMSDTTVLVDFEAEITPDAIIVGTDDRTRISPVHGLPYRMIVKLRLQFPDKAGDCTGWFAGPHTIVTAGHCIYRTKAGGWLNGVYVYLEKDDASFRKIKYISNNQQCASTASICGPFRKAAQFNGSEEVGNLHDYGAIILPDDELGNLAGWFVAESPLDSVLNGRWFELAGYPTDVDKMNYHEGYQLWRHADYALSESGIWSADWLKYYIDATEGQSGSPVFYSSPPGPVYKVNAIHHGGSVLNNLGTRISSAVLDDLIKWEVSTSAQQCWNLTTNISNGGSSTVSRTLISGYECGDYTNYAAGAIVQLTTNPASGYAFSNWSGEGCSGAGTCTVTMTAARNVTANFNTIVNPTNLVQIPAGSFLMGSLSTDPYTPWSGEKPQHTVNLSQYYIDRTEVTNEMYRKCDTDGFCTSPSNASSPTRSSYYGNPAYNTYPIIYVTWAQAETYCEWTGGRLPTEAEWERAARGTDARYFPWGNATPSCDLANFNNCMGDTSPVDDYPAGVSQAGLLNMAGNVFEWVSDWMSSSYYGSSPVNNPQGPVSGTDRVIRGGDWSTTSIRDIRVVSRGGTKPTTANHMIGFRCAYSSLPISTTPVVSSIARADANPSNAANVRFTVNFSKPVVGINMAAPFSDFVLTNNGVTNAAITSVSGSGESYVVAVTTGSGNGTIRLDVVDDDSIRDLANNPLGGVGEGNGNYSSGQSYAIIKGSSFTDVPTTHLYFNDIEILYANNMTGGCQTSPLKFCPDQIMNRAQAAAFMLRGNFGQSYVPPVPQHIFHDDWTKGPWAEGWAEGMKDEGFSAGCLANPMKYCPWDQIPREQAVIFALKLKNGKLYTPPPATGTLFADMTNPSFYATAWAEQAYKDGLIPNCGMSGGKPKICPKELVSRGLAAYMIVRAKNLTMQ
jgi:formylglycine-generating enzyme required for sulfatase activity/V8-like Glu-specific endopeptidase